MPQVGPWWSLVVKMKIKIDDIEVEVADIKTDSRKVGPCDLFIAYKGVGVDGSNYIPQAVENGAKVVVGEINAKIADIPDGVRYYQVADGREFWVKAEAQKYGNPQKKLKLIGITGTDGKTTTVNFIYTILKSSSKHVGMISTVSARYENKVISTGLHTTTPAPGYLYKILRKMVDSGIKYVVLEVTSHGLIQKRVFGIHFIISVITNVSKEHLDAHGTYSQLIRDKLLISERSDITFLNKKGVGFNLLIRRIPKKAKTIVIQGDEAADLVLKEFTQRFPGDYNIQNASLACEICKYLGLKKRQVKDGINSIKRISGRFEWIPNNLGINIIVDFAHTEIGIKSILNAVKMLKGKSERTITVFGCAGERDIKKRPKMGKVASNLSDIVILTSEDPRSEDPNRIIDEIASGNSKFDFIKEVDRKTAIYKGLELVKKGDWVLILGKGHEKSMNIKGVEVPWSDRGVVKKWLNKPRKSITG